MIAFSDITLFSAIPSLIKLSDLPNWQRLLIEYEIYDCQRLLDFVRAGSLEFQDRKFYSILESASKLVIYMNSRNIAPDIIKFDLPKDENERRLFSIADREVIVNRLPTFHPATQTKSSFGSLEMNIETIKMLLGKLTLEGKNGIYLFFSPRLIIKELLLRGIPLYHEQLRRVIQTLPDISNYRENVFELDRDEKREIVNEHIDMIIEFMLENGEEFVWGTLLNRNREDLIKDIRRGKENRFKNYIKDVVTDYTTLEELEKDPLGSETLKRFIITPKKKF